MAAILVEMGETGATRESDTQLQAGGLGACVGLCLYEAGVRAAVLVHIVLPKTLTPSSFAGRMPHTPSPGKCADTAIPHALAEIQKLGGQISRVEAAIVGGAHIFTGGATDNAPISRLEIGQRNILAIKEALLREGIPLTAEETGGQGGRTVSLDAATGGVWVRPVGLTDRLLVILGRVSGPQPAKAKLQTPVLEGAQAYGL